MACWFSDCAKHSHFQLVLPIAFFILFYDSPLISVRKNGAEAFGLIGVGYSKFQRGSRPFSSQRSQLCRVSKLLRVTMSHSMEGNSSVAVGSVNQQLNQRNISFDFESGLSLDKSKSHFSGKLAFLEGSRLYEDTDFYTLNVWKTPLWMITQEPDLNNLVQYLQDLRLEILSAPRDTHLIRFSRAKIEKARSAFSRMVRRGEMRLHRLCELTADEILGGNYTRQSVVVGQRPTRDQQRFQVSDSNP